jgi:hypothetical protein
MSVAMVVAATTTRRVPSLRVPEFIATVKSIAHTMAWSAAAVAARIDPALPLVLLLLGDPAKNRKALRCSLRKSI